MDKLATWLQIIANVGILGSLVLLALQMEQSADLTKLQLLRDDSNSHISAEQAYVGEQFAVVWEKMILEPENLTLAEMRILDSNIWSQGLYRWWNNYELYQAGLLSEDDWKTPIKSDAGYLLLHPYGRAYWDEVRQPGELFNEEFTSFVDEVLARSDARAVGPEEFYENIQNRLQGYLRAQKTKE